MFTAKLIAIVRAFAIIPGCLKIVLSLVRTAAAHTKGGGIPGSTRLRLVAIAAFLLFVLGAGAQAPAAAGDAVGPGCDPARPAVAYHAESILGGDIIPPAPRPSACPERYACRRHETTERCYTDKL